MGALSNVATLGLNFALAQKAARQQSGDVNRERDRQVREIQARNEEERRRRQEELRRRLAAQRARAGAAGVGGGGSAQAVLRGLTEEAEATYLDRLLILPRGDEGLPAADEVRGHRP